MGEINLKTIEDIIEARKFTALVGLKEGIVFEAKSARPYDLAAASAQYELAKDVSAFANSDGGWLIIGLTTERAPNEPIDVVTTLDLVSEADFPAPKIEGLLREYVVPRIAGLRVAWIANDPPDGLGIGVVHVPPQPEETKPFIIAKVVEGSERIKQIIVGYCRRLGGDSVPHDANQIQFAMRQGLSIVSQRLSSIEQKISLLLESATQLPQAPQSTVEADALLAARIRRIMGE